MDVLKPNNPKCIIHIRYTNKSVESDGVSKTSSI
jgi:hypothetical protein